MMQQPPTLTRSNETDIPGIFTSEHVSLDVPSTGADGRPPAVKYTYAYTPICPYAGGSSSSSLLGD